MARTYNGILERRTSEEREQQAIQQSVVPKRRVSARATCFRDLVQEREPPVKARTAKLDQRLL